MKYIIESNDVIGYTPKYAMLFGDGYMIQPLEDLEELNSDYINEHFGDLQGEAYRQGSEELRNVLIEISEADTDTRKKYFDYFPIIDILVHHSASKIVEKWRARKQDDEINVGDEVRSTYAGRVMEDFTPWVVTLVTSETCYGFDADGTPRNNPITMVQKTGRHFDISKFLEEMQR